MKIINGLRWRPNTLCRTHSCGKMALVESRPQQLSTRNTSRNLSHCRSKQEQSSTARIVSRSTAPKKAYIALGSNVGDRVGNIERACRELDKDRLRVTRTSSLYETAPMYVEDQDLFVNGVCEAEVDDGVEPLQLLEKVKDIENRLGRQKTIDKGPRNIDLDILLHGDWQFKNEDLNIPHALMLEREFVLRPLCDLIPEDSHPSQPETSYASQLDTLPPSEPPISTLTPLSSSLSLRPNQPTRPTHVMAILNLTPDSFSDGSLHSPTKDTLLPLIRNFVSSGATIIDIGGQSTAPRTPEVSAEEELSRVIPAIQLIRSHPDFSSLAISIDTYRASVARAAIEAGADIVNDISAGTMDPAMLLTVAELGCTYIMMHMRGTPADMTKRASYPQGLIPTIAQELQERLRAAEQAGIRRWRIVLDPGIGFAKNSVQNLELLRRFWELRDRQELRGFPWLVGASRKAFVGKITGVKEPRERVWGTAAVVSVSVQGGADIVRVHDVDKMAQVRKMADAIWRVKDCEQHK